MSRGSSLVLLGAAALVLALGIGIGFALGVTAQTIGVRTPLYAAVVVLLALFVVGMLVILYRFIESYQRSIRALQDPARGVFASGSAQQGALGGLAGTAELVRALQEFEERMTALQRLEEKEGTPVQGSEADLVTPSESVQNRDTL